VIEPVQLPEGYSIAHAAYLAEKNTVCLYSRASPRFDCYGGVELVIAQKYGVTETLETIYHDAPDMYDEPFMVRGQQALYWQGCYTDAGWTRECGMPQGLIWFEDGIEYYIWAGFSPGGAGETLIAIAESLR
jgi:hypothetical protein